MQSFIPRINLRN